MKHLADIGQQLAVRRRALGMSQRELGARLGVLQPQVARWEADSYASASLARVSAAADALGIGLATRDLPLAAEASATYAPERSPLTRLSVAPEVVAAFCRSHHVTRLELFGSILTARFSAASDVDVLATYASGESPGLMQLGDHELELGAILGRKVDLHTRASVERNPNPVMRDAILGTAQVVYEA